MEENERKKQTQRRDCFFRVGAMICAHPAALIGICAVAAVVFWMGKFAVREHKIQQEIASEVVRFRVKANSDTIRDQKIKLQVRDALLAQINDLLEVSGCESKEASEKLLEGQLSELQQTAVRTVTAAGSSDPVLVTFGKSYFPEKNYGDCTLPAGIYDALQVTIGEGLGHNWWCMLYPSLCFADAFHPVLEEEGEAQLKLVLSEESYDYILRNAEITFGFYWF
ncbi:MAG: stage II sporulation protein R [Fusicatenibacter sp.]|nr:stage II sporulation protein R [Lachnospiraceae bacterium]MDY2938301.1 stage II sporulation protein R [Fusicatenibacter sp.]